MNRIGFVTLFIIAISSLYFYLGWSLHSAYGWLILTVLFALVFSFPFMRSSPLLTQATFLGMGFLSYLIVFAILKDLIRLAGFTLHPNWTYAAALLAVLIGTFIAHRGPTVVKLRLPVKDLPAALENFRIVQISDLHVGPTIGKSYVDKIVITINEMQPDILTMTGDIGDGPVAAHKEDMAPVASIKTKYGSYYVPGNHEYYWNANEWMNLMSGLNVVVLLNRGEKIQVKDVTVLVAGVSDPAGRPAPDPVSALKGGEDSNYKILLSHRPGIANEAAKLGYHLQLSGHTHGGQFFPWTLAVRFAHQYFLGHYLVDSMWLNVNSGTGSWGPFLRLGTTSEITQIELYRSDNL